MISVFALSLVEALVLGLHLLAPTWAARLPPERRRLIGLVLAPALLAVVILRLATSRPEDAAEAGLVAGARPVAVLAVCLVALLCADLIAFVGGAKLEKSGWWLVSAFGLGGAAALAWAAESLVRGPVAGTAAANVATGVRLLLMLATAEALVGSRHRWAPVAGAIGVPLLWWSLPPIVRHGVVDLGAGPVLLAAALLLVLALVVPARLRRATAVAGVLAAWLLMAAIDHSWRSGRTFSESLPVQELSL